MAGICWWIRARSEVARWWSEVACSLVIDRPAIVALGLRVGKRALSIGGSMVSWLRGEGVVKVGLSVNMIWEGMVCFCVLGRKCRVIRESGM